MSDVSLQKVLQKYFDHMRSKNSRYSLRALATKIGLAPGATHEILNGKRQVSRALAEKIADRIALDPSERADLLSFYVKSPKQVNNSAKKNLNKQKIVKLDTEQFELISDWVHFAILSLLRLPDFSSDISWIADRLGITIVDARKALIRLQHLSLVKIHEGGKMTRTESPIRTTDDIWNPSLQQMHLNDMAIAKSKLQEIPLELRDFTNYTFPANPEKMKRAKEILRNAQDELEDLMNDSHASEVYRVCMYLFPLSKIQTRN